MSNPTPASSDTASSRPGGILDRLLGLLVSSGGSDMHLSAGEPVRYRIDGRLSAIEAWRSTTFDTASIRALALHAITDDRDDAGGHLLDEAGRVRRLERMQRVLDQDHRLDFAYSSKDHGRFRVNLFMQRRGMGAVFRRIPSSVPSVDDLSLPSAIRGLASLRKGLVLLCGPTGSGKSTTLAALIDLINHTNTVHVLTIEDPIEFVHVSKTALINQREIGLHTLSFKQALKDGLRQDPDVILVGEMRDLETIELAMTAAETGHLVFATLHANSSIKAIDRIVDVFPSDQQNQIRTQLSTTMQAIVTQQLLPSIGGRGRVAAHEILISTPAVMSMIRDGRLEQVAGAIQTGQKFGMQLMDKALVQLARGGKITHETAILHADKPADVTRELRTGAGALFAE